MIKTFISLLIILIFVSTKVQSLDQEIEEILNEIKQINQKVDLLNEKADNNHKIIKIMQEEVRKNFTKIDSRIEMNCDFKNEVFDKLNSMQNDMKVIKTLEENTKTNSDILKNEMDAVMEFFFLTLNPNIGKIEQEVIKTKEEVETSSDRIFQKVKPIRDEIIKKLESFEYEVNSLNHTIIYLFINSLKFHNERITRI